MRQDRVLKLLIRRLHKWIGIVSCVFMLLVSLTALGLNHREAWQGLIAPVAVKGFTLAQARVWAADPHHRGQLLAADAHHLWQSRDNGRSWAELKLYVPAEAVSGIAYDPRRAGRLWVALADAGIYASDDGGELWEALDATPFDPVAGERIEGLAAGGGQLYVRTRNGQHALSLADGRWDSRTSPGASERLSLQDWLWRLHTGRGMGLAGLVLYDGIALALILLALSGLVIAFRSKRKPAAGQGIKSMSAAADTALK